MPYTVLTWKELESIGLYKATNLFFKPSKFSLYFCNIHLIMSEFIEWPETVILNNDETHKNTHKLNVCENYNIKIIQTCNYYIQNKKEIKQF